MIDLLEKYSRVSWIFVLLIAITIFYVSGLPAKVIGPPGWPWKAIAYHFFAFFFLAFFLLPALVRGKRRSFIFIAAVIAIVYGVLDEFHQLFVIGRCCAFSDFLINSAGILTSSFIYSVSLRRRKNLRQFK